LHVYEHSYNFDAIDVVRIYKTKYVYLYYLKYLVFVNFHCCNVNIIPYLVFC